MNSCSEPATVFSSQNCRVSYWSSLFECQSCS